MKRRTGFTLAEVLITLGVIGIVAAMTMPSLVQNYKKKEASARLKKFYSSMSQAITLSEIDNGEVAEWVFPGFRNKAETEVFARKYILPYFNNLKTANDVTISGDAFAIYLNDGSNFTMSQGACLDIHYDINGDRKPNQHAKDRFVFLLCPQEAIVMGCGQQFQKFPFCGYGQTAQSNRETQVANCKINATVCVTLIMLDNWEFKDDYPYKL
ncbi:MAG: type II secretion system GspH family protein [Heliobacteriaceae bacterium]|jgi:prepilin-type N-terminal cleavage/methylation domain-containing protein|nr:type II secretion system GspH family protein [Heliobacteriaceae bacterium]